MSGLMEFPGVVEWSGENPLMSLKTTSEGPFVTLASFFRVVLSPHGRGHVLVLLQSPHDARPPFERANYCFADNMELATFLIDGYISHFAAYKGLAAMTNLQFLPIDEASSAGDPRKSYAEIISSRGMRIEQMGGARRAVLPRVSPGKIGNRETPYADRDHRQWRRECNDRWTSIAR